MSFTHCAKLALLGALIGVLPSPVQALPYESIATGQEHKFLTNKTLPFAVDGANLPDIDWDIGENYAGLLPIGDKAGNELFFWFVPANNSVASKEITIWLNGGPGCSSMLGLLQENGPISWQAGQLAPMPNIYSWSNLTNVVWVDQPAGTGYSNISGPANYTNEIEVAAGFLGFWKNFVDTFDMQGSKVTITGESYAGNYVPYIAEAMLNTTGTAHSDYFNVTGILMYDPILGDRAVGDSAPVADFVKANANLFAFDDEDLKELEDASKSCGYEAMMRKASQYPPKGHIAVPSILNVSGLGTSTSIIENDDCDLFSVVNALAMESNPCFNVYYIGQPCPFPGDIVGDPYHENAAGSPPDYFAREDVQKALHAPSMPEWELCANGIFYNTIDESPPSAANNGPLKTVIEKTNNVIIGHGTLDMVLMINGSLLALQNLTWNGEQGFSKPPQKDMVVPYYPQGIVAQSGNGTLGKWTESRGLTFCTVEMSGHQVPGFQPGVAYRHLEKLLGRIESLDDAANFTTSDLHFQPDEIQFEPPNEVHLAKRREQHARRA